MERAPSWHCNTSRFPGDANDPNHKYSTPVFQLAKFKRPGEYDISPYLQSEAIFLKDRTPLSQRRYGSWPYEFHGARTWPFASEGERAQFQGLLERHKASACNCFPTCKCRPQDPCASCFRATNMGLPPGMKDEFHSHIRSPAPRPCGPQAPKWNGYVTNRCGAVFGNASRPPTISCEHPLIAPQANEREREFRTRYGSSRTLAGYTGIPNYEEYFDHINIQRRLTHPDDRKPDPSRAIIDQNFAKRSANEPFTEEEKRRAMILHPDLPPEQRPKFSKPYLNFANAMFIGCQFPDSPGFI